MEKTTYINKGSKWNRKSLRQNKNMLNLFSEKFACGKDSLSSMKLCLPRQDSMLLIDGWCFVILRAIKWTTQHGPVEVKRSSCFSVFFQFHFCLLNPLLLFTQEELFVRPYCSCYFPFSQEIFHLLLSHFPFILLDYPALLSPTSFLGSLLNIPISPTFSFLLFFLCKNILRV